MKYRLSISNYGKLLIILRNTAIIGISSVFIFVFLLKNKYLILDSILGIILFLITILPGPLYLIIQIRQYYINELLSIDNKCIKSLRFGIIKFNNIKSYKILKFNSDEILIIKMLDGTKYAIQEINYKKENYKQYTDFKNQFLKIITEENIKRFSENMIIEEKSYLKYLPQFYFVIILLMLIYWLFNHIS